MFQFKPKFKRTNFDFYLARKILDFRLWMGLIRDINKFKVPSTFENIFIFHNESLSTPTQSYLHFRFLHIFFFSIFIIFSSYDFTKIEKSNLCFLKIFSFLGFWINYTRFWIFESSNWLRFELISLDKSFLFSSFSHFKGVIGLLLRVLSSFRINLRRREKHDF